MIQPQLTPLELALSKALHLVVDELPSGLCMARGCTQPAVLLDANDRIVGPLVLELCAQHAKTHVAARDRTYVPGG